MAGQPWRLRKGRVCSGHVRLGVPGNTKTGSSMAQSVHSWIMKGQVEAETIHQQVLGENQET